MKKDEGELNFRVLRSELGIIMIIGGCEFNIRIGFVIEKAGSLIMLNMALTNKKKSVKIQKK